MANFAIKCNEHHHINTNFLILLVLKNTKNSSFTVAKNLKITS